MIRASSRTTNVAAVALFKRRIKNGVAGTAQVVGSSHYSGRGVYENCQLQLVVQAEGIPAYSTTHTQLCPGRKWPHAGTVLPVTISRSDPHKLRIDFDQVPEAHDQLAAAAEAQAAMLRGETPVGGSVTPNVQFVGGSPADLDPDKRAKLEHMLGIDLDGDGVVGAGQPVAAGGDDRVARLERLAALRQSGALTDAEFEAEKARILGS